MQNPPDWQEILTYFRGSELQNYFMRILEDDLHAIIKPQYVDHIPKAVRYVFPFPLLHPFLIFGVFAVNEPPTFALRPLCVCEPVRVQNACLYMRACVHLTSLVFRQMRHADLIVIPCRTIASTNRIRFVCSLSLHGHSADVASWLV